MITNKEKDLVLTWLCENLIPERLIQLDNSKLSELYAYADLSYEELHAILTYFQREGFIGTFTLHRHLNYLRLTLFLQALEHFQRGGFTAV